MHSLSSGRLLLREAVGRGIDFNLGEVGRTNVVAESRAERKIVRSALLPNISGYLSETVQQINLGATGFSFDQRSLSSGAHETCDAIRGAASG
jgi:hypothetical protein